MVRDSGEVCRVSLVGECGGKGAVRESVIMGFMFMCLPELFIESFHDQPGVYDIVVRSMMAKTAPMIILVYGWHCTGYSSYLGDCLTRTILSDLFKI